MTDREILDYIKSDNQRGMEYLIDRFSSLVFKIASSVILPVGNIQDVEECVSDVFISVYNNLQKIDLEKASLKGFLAMVAKRNAISFYRSLKRQAESESIENHEEIQFAENGVDYETKKALLSAVKGLGEPDCTIVTRRYIFGETAREISEYVQLSPAAVQKRLERSMERLREILGGVICG